MNAQQRGNEIYTLTSPIFVSFRYWAESKHDSKFILPGAALLLRRYSCHSAPNWGVHVTKYGKFGSHATMPLFEAFILKLFTR